ncbi:B-cell receptor CD22-like isoform X2 [Festucalex cinctus]
MSWTAQKGFVIFVILLFHKQVLATSGWEGTYASSRAICGLTGSTVTLNCSFKYPATAGRINKTLWFKTGSSDKPDDLSLDPNYSGRLNSPCEKDWCSLSISQLKESDVGTYKFRLVTTGNKFTFKPGVDLRVTDLNVEVSPFYLKCATGAQCSLGSSASYIWYENGEEIQDATSREFRDFDSKHSYSCAVRGQQQLTSRPVCTSSQCNKVLYKSRSICALKGSSVDISCTYSAYNQVRSKFWFRTDRNLDDQSDTRLQFPQESYRKSTLRIKNVMESDAGEYRFKFTTLDFEWKSSLPGTTLTVTAVQVQVINVERQDSHIVAQLSCHTSCSPPDPWYLCWKQNERRVGNCVPSNTAIIHVQMTLQPGEYVSCSAEGYQVSISSPPLYVLKAPRVSLMTSLDDIMEGRPLTLTCTTDTSTSRQYRWFKKNGNLPVQDLRTDGPQLVFSAIRSSDSAEYFCSAANGLGEKMSKPVQVDVKYAPKFFHLRASPSNVIDEGQSVTLSCGSDAKPAASYTLYKDNQTVQRHQKPEGFLEFRTQHAGSFYCVALNKYGNVKSSTVVVDVQYAPRIPNVSAIPSDYINVGSLVTLTCSSDANPNASYTWYKDQQSSPVSKAAVFNISDYQAHHNGEYRCEAWNSKGRTNATLRLHANASPLTVATVGGITAGMLLVLLLVTVLLLRKKLASKAQPNSNANGGTDRPDELVYSTVVFNKDNKDTPIYSNVAGAKRHPHEDEDEGEGVEYTAVKCNSSRATGLKPQGGR